MRAVIFANGNFAGTPRERGLVRPDDWLIAANGGARLCEALGLTPDVIIGDFDSLSQQKRLRWDAAGVELVTHPARKDYTDLELALQHALEKDITQILILGGLGQRWDQTLANVLLAGNPAYAQTQITLVDGNQDMHPMHGGHTLSLDGHPDDIVSLIPLLADAHGVTTQGLEYSLAQATLRFGSTRGISNRLLHTQAQVQLEEGLLLCIHIHGQKDTPEQEGG